MKKHLVIEMGASKKYFNVTYRDELLVAVKFFDDCDLTPENNEWFWRFIPTTLDGLHAAAKQKNLRIIPVKEDLSFDTFWNEYGYKKKKADAQKVWNKMNDDDKRMALAVLPKYRYWLSTKNNMEQMYPSTYLRQRRWEDDYKI